MRLAILTSPTVIIPTESANKKFIVQHAARGNLPIRIKHADSQSILLQPYGRQWIFSDGQSLFTLQSAPRLKTIPFANPLILDWSDADRILVQLTGDTTIRHANALPGQTVTLILQQDEIGNHQVIWDDNVRFGTTIPQLILTTVPNKHDKITFVFNDDGAGYYDVALGAHGF
jgi:hypothetical protein